MTFPMPVSAYSGINDVYGPSEEDQLDDAISNWGFEDWTGGEPDDWQTEYEQVVYKERVTWHDDCSSADDWVEQSTWPNAMNTIQTGIPLYSDGDALYSGDIPYLASSNHGPTFARSLGLGAKVSDNLDLSVTIEHPNPANRMGHVYVTIYDTNCEKLFGVSITDVWYGGLSRSYARYFRTSAEGGGYEYVTVDHYNAYTDTLHVWYESGYIYGSTYGSTDILYEPGEFDEDRTVAFATITFGNKDTPVDYDYQTNYVHNIELTAELPIQTDFHDACDSPSEWDAVHWWQYADVKIQEDIDLLTSSGKLYSASIPGDASHGNHGPQYLRGLGTAIKLGNDIDFSVDLEHPYVANRMGHVMVTLHDTNGERLLTIRIVDAWYWIRSDAGVFYWKSAEEGGSYIYKYKSINYGYSGVISIWYENGYLKYDILGTTGTLCNPGEFDPERVAGSISIAFGNKYTYNYQTNYIRDIEVTSSPKTTLDFDFDGTGTSGWHPVSGDDWPQPPFTETVDEPLHSDGDSLYVDSIPGGTGYHGPLFYKELPAPVMLGANLDLRVDLEWFYGSYSEDNMGAAFVTLYDTNYERVMTIRFKDVWAYSDTMCRLSLYYYRTGSFANEFGGSVVEEHTYYTTHFQGQSRIYYDDGYLKASVPQDSWTLCNPDEFNEARMIQYMTLAHAAVDNWDYNPVYVDRMSLESTIGEVTLWQILDDNIYWYADSHSLRAGPDQWIRSTQNLVISQNLDSGPQHTTEFLKGRVVEFSFMASVVSTYQQRAPIKARCEYTSGGQVYTIDGPWMFAAEHDTWNEISVQCSVPHDTTSFTASIVISGQAKSFVNIDEAQIAVAASSFLFDDFGKACLTLGLSYSGNLPDSQAMALLHSAFAVSVDPYYIHPSYPGRQVFIKDITLEAYLEPNDWQNGYADIAAYLHVDRYVDMNDRGYMKDDPYETQQEHESAAFWGAVTIEALIGGAATAATAGTVGAAWAIGTWVFGIATDIGVGLWWEWWLSETTTYDDEAIGKQWHDPPRDYMWNYYTKLVWDYEHTLETFPVGVKTAAVSQDLTWKWKTNVDYSNYRVAIRAVVRLGVWMVGQQGPTTMAIVEEHVLLYYFTIS